MIFHDIFPNTLLFSCVCVCFLHFFFAQFERMIMRDRIFVRKWWLRIKNDGRYLPTKKFRYVFKSNGIETELFSAEFDLLADQSRCYSKIVDFLIQFFVFLTKPTNTFEMRFIQHSQYFIEQNVRERERKLVHCLRGQFILHLNGLWRS